jgi:hypothetical protein
VRVRKKEGERGGCGSAVGVEVSQAHADSLAMELLCGFFVSSFVLQRCLVVDTVLSCDLLRNVTGDARWMDMTVELVAEEVVG